MENVAKSKNKKIKVLLLFILIVLIVLCILTVRKIIIINKYINKISEFNTYTNYHFKEYIYCGEVTHIIEAFKKDNKDISSLTAISQQLTQDIGYRDNENDEWIEISNTGTEKTAWIGNHETGVATTIDIPTMYLGKDNIFKILTQVNSITSEMCNGKQCYLFKIYAGAETVRFWIDKETFLIVRSIVGYTTDEEEGQIDTIQDYIYEFNTVTDEDVARPDLTDCTVKHR